MSWKAIDALDDARDATTSLLLPFDAVDGRASHSSPSSSAASAVAVAPVATPEQPRPAAAGRPTSRSIPCPGS
nr:hypothetical protein [Haloferax sp. ATB1]